MCIAVQGNLNYLPIQSIAQESSLDQTTFVLRRLNLHPGFIFPPFSQSETTFFFSFFFLFCFPEQSSPYKMESTLEGKNLLLGEQILPFKSRLHQELNNTE